MYPKKKADDEPGRECFFTNKLSVVRLCRGQKNLRNSWEVHIRQAESFIRNSDNVFRGFLVADALYVKNHGLDGIVQDGNERNPYHAHILIPDYNLPYRDDVSMISEILPFKIRENLDRLRLGMKTIILNRGERYPDDLNYASPSDPICEHCHNVIL